MTDYVPYQNGPLATSSLVSDDTLYVASGIVVTQASNAETAVYTALDSTNVSITVDGTVAGSDAIGVGDSTCTLYIGSGGTVQGSDVSVFSSANSGVDGGCVYNDGRILGGAVGMYGNINNSVSELHNSGLIQAGRNTHVTSSGDAVNAAIFNFANLTETQTIENTGTIKTLLSGSYAFLSQGTVTENINNSGTMIGKIDLGGGNDLYDGRLGHVQGTVLGGAGDDVITGGTEANAIEGDGGHDSLTGGLGADTFLYKALADSTLASTGRDYVKDFSHSQGDKIDLHLIDANAGIAGDQAFTFIGSAAFGRHSGELRAADYGTAYTIITGDVNGDAAVDFAIIVNKTAFVAGDFVL